MIQPIILAAGKGTRMQSDVPKVLHEVGGRPMLEHVLSTLKEAAEPALLEPIVVVGYGAEQIEARYPGLTFAHQPKLTGTATAIEAALPKVDARARYALVLYGDNPFVSVETIGSVIEIAVRYRPTLVCGVINVPDFRGTNKSFSAFGRVVLDEVGYPVRIVEEKSATEEELKITTLNAGLCAVELSWLKCSLPMIEPSRQNGERYLTLLLEFAHMDRRDVELIEMRPVEAFGVNSKDDLATLAGMLDIKK